MTTRPGASPTPEFAQCRFDPITTFVHGETGREFSWGACPLCKTVVTVSATVPGIKRNLRRHMRAKHPKEDIRLRTRKGPCRCKVCRARSAAAIRSRSQAGGRE